MAREQRIVLTEEDLDRLTTLVETHAVRRDRDELEALEAELERAEVVPPDSLPPGVVRMYSRVRFVDEETGAPEEVTLVYPQDADPARGRVSVLAPVGSALLGVSTGQCVEWPVPRRGTRRLRVVEVVHAGGAEGAEGR